MITFRLLLAQRLDTKLAESALVMALGLNRDKHCFEMHAKYPSEIAESSGKKPGLERKFEIN